MIIENFPADFLLGKYELKGVKAYGNKFMLTKPERLLSLIKRVSQELNVNEDKLDYSENSLDYITEWLKKHVSTRKLTKAEYELKRKTFQIISMWMIGISTKLQSLISSTLVHILAKL